MRRSFTLIEVLTTITIIGILASLGSYGYAIALTRSRDNSRIADLQSIHSGLEQFYLDNRSYPVFQQDLAGKIKPEAVWQLEDGKYPCQDRSSKKYLSPKYLAQLPQDPSKKFSINRVPDCDSDPFGQYLYFAMPKTASPTNYYLMARMERSQNVNYNVGVGVILSGYNGLPNFCSIIAPDCSQNYFVTNSENN